MLNEANRLGIAYHLIARLEITQKYKIYFNSAIVFDYNEVIVVKYRKLHLSGLYKYKYYNF